MKNKSISFEQLETRNMMSASPIDVGLSETYNRFYSDKHISRPEMMGLLLSSTDRNVIDATEISDLRNIVRQSNMPDHVKYFANNILNGSIGNNYYRGQRLGNLLAGSNATTMLNLVDKWFRGSDRPSLGSFSNTTNYRYVQGSLFVNGPSHEDARQGQLGDCYLLTAIQGMAFSNPQSIRNMFIDNGDNTWTVKFFGNNKQPNYVTVDRFLPVDNRGFARFAAFRGHANNPSNELWVSLIEKAYAQWHEFSGLRQSVNSYQNISGGWAQVATYHMLGINPVATRLNNFNTITSHLQNKTPITISIDRHTYLITSYNTQTQRFRFHNPWGYSHLDLTWSEINIRGYANRTVYLVQAKFA